MKRNALNLTMLMAAFALVLGISIVLTPSRTAEGCGWLPMESINCQGAFCSICQPLDPNYPQGFSFRCIGGTGHGFCTWAQKSGADPDAYWCEDDNSLPPISCRKKEVYQTDNCAGPSSAGNPSKCDMQPATMLSKPCRISET